MRYMILLWILQNHINKVGFIYCICDVAFEKTDYFLVFANAKTKLGFMSA
ncbi:hypothetical protein JN11_04676 [Mucilaginibacter frigoritolerans]|uniref:Uncharacterized protein n=1 Tax=Mucilaginibacter frigoritolerans TaxID=652788 RepID=A0A562TN94_9SPHI|nr:hypothetical protein JN11_04676 [Mucilaginibacter frigoritolerans]